MIQNDVKYAVQILLEYPEFFKKELDAQVPLIPEDKVASVYHAIGGIDNVLAGRHMAIVRKRYLP